VHNAANMSESEVEAATDRMRALDLA
jgi:hypothetical protein